MIDKRNAIRGGFDSAAAQYERARPSYPKVLIDDLISRASLPDVAEILEIGSGTGKATELFAQRGYSLDCLDIGEDLTAIAAEKLKKFDRVRFWMTTFEDWNPNGRSYDLVLAAASFHWVNPRVRFTKSAQMLRDSGSLALLANKHVRQNEGFFAHVKDLYHRHAPSMGQINNERKKLWAEPVLGEELFHKPQIRKHSWVAAYTTEQYIELLSTYSDHISLPQRERLPLFEGIAELIETEYGGVVHKHYDSILTLLTLRRRQGPIGRP